MSGIAVLKEVKTTGVHGGASTANVWSTRILNSLESNQGSPPWCSYNAITGEFTLKAGKYLIDATTTGVGVDSHQVRVFNVTTGSATAYGMSSLSYALTPSNSSLANVADYININVNSTFAIQHYCKKAVPNFGLGFAANIPGNQEVYTTVKISKY